MSSSCNWPWKTKNIYAILDTRPPRPETPPSSSNRNAIDVCHGQRLHVLPILDGMEMVIAPSTGIFHGENKDSSNAGMTVAHSNPGPSEK